jgi:hypothetical protein
MILLRDRVVVGGLLSVMDNLRRNIIGHCTGIRHESSFAAVMVDEKLRCSADSKVDDQLLFNVDSWVRALRR